MVFNPQHLTVSHIMNVDGSEQVRLTNNSADDGQPSFSPDGSKITFESDRDGNTEIYIMNVDGSEQVRLTNNVANDLYPTFLPGESKIAFESDRYGNYKIYAINVDGSENVRLTKGGGLLGPWAFSFSSDGSGIYFNYFYGGNHDVCGGRTDGTVIVCLTSDHADDGYPSVSPYKSIIAFESNRDGNYEIYIMDNFGSVQINLTNNPSNDRFPAFSPVIVEVTEIGNIPYENYLGDYYLSMSMSETGIEVETLCISKSGYAEYARLDQGCMYEYRIGQLSEESMEKLSEHIKSSGFFDLEDVYDCPEYLSVEGTISLSVFRNGEVKSVHEVGIDAPDSFYSLIGYLQGYLQREIIASPMYDSRDGTFIKVKEGGISTSENIISEEELEARPLLAKAIDNPGWFIYIDTLTNAGLDDYTQDEYDFYLNFKGNLFQVSVYETNW